MFLREDLLTDVKNSNFKIFESALYLKSGSMPLNTSDHITTFRLYHQMMWPHFPSCCHTVWFRKEERKINRIAHSSAVHWIFCGSGIICQETLEWYIIRWLLMFFKSTFSRRKHWWVVSVDDRSPIFDCMH